MACEGSILNCVMNEPTVAGIGVVAGFAIAKAMQMRKRRRGGMGGMGFQ